MPRMIRFALIAGLTLLTSAAISTAQSTDFPNGPQYLITNGQSTLFLRSIQTPSLSFGPASAVAVPFNTGEDLSASRVVETPRPLPNGVDYSRIFWGEREQPAETGMEENVIEISGSQSVAALPSSILGDGVTAFVDDQSLHAEGLGVPLGNVAAYWKAHKEPAVRTFTNKDIVRSSGS